MSLIAVAKQELGEKENVTVPLPPAKKVYVKVGDVSFLRFFTAEETTVQTHYLGTRKGGTSREGNIYCLGNECPVCKAGERVTTIDLLPVYNADEDDVQVLFLAHTEDARTGKLSLRQQVLRFFSERPSDYSQWVVPIRKPDQFTLQLDVADPVTEEGLGEDRIADFTNLSEEDQQRWIKSVIPSLSREQVIATYPKVAYRLARLVG